MTEKARRRRWAEDQIATLRKQIESTQGNIEQLQAFVALLDASDVALEPNGGAPQARPAGRKKRRRRSLGDFISEALDAAGPAGLSPQDVAAKVEGLGYRHRGKASLKIAVASELYRQAKRGNRGIIRVAKGRYARKPGAGHGKEAG